MAAHPSQLHIRLDDLSDPRIEAFMEEHLRDMRATSPPASWRVMRMLRSMRWKKILKSFV